MEGEIDRRLIQCVIDQAQFTTNERGVKGFKCRRLSESTGLGSFKKVKEIICTEAIRENQTTVTSGRRSGRNGRRCTGRQRSLEGRRWGIWRRLRGGGGERGHQAS